VNDFINSVIAFKQKSLKYLIILADCSIDKKAAVTCEGGLE
jgi:hypothetical protein